MEKVQREAEVHLGLHQPRHLDEELEHGAGNYPPGRTRDAPVAAEETIPVVERGGGDAPDETGSVDHLADGGQDEALPRLQNGNGDGRAAKEDRLQEHDACELDDDWPLGIVV